MEKYKNLNLIFGMLICFLMICCASTKKETSAVDAIPENAIKVTVTDYSDLDGCEFLLIDASGKKLQPINLPTEFKKDGMLLLVTYKITNGMGICMAGEMVELIFVGKQNVK